MLHRRGSFSVKIVYNSETGWTSAEERPLIKLCRLPPGLRWLTDWAGSRTRLFRISRYFKLKTISSGFSLQPRIYYRLFSTPAISNYFFVPNSSKWRDSTVPIYFCVSWFFLDEIKNLSYCGPKDFFSCVIPLNGKLLRIHTWFSDPCSL